MSIHRAQNSWFKLRLARIIFQIQMIFLGDMAPDVLCCFRFDCSLCPFVIDYGSGLIDCSQINIDDKFRSIFSFEFIGLGD